jgi:nitrite reductase (NADH) small subunit
MTIVDVAPKLANDLPCDGWVTVCPLSRLRLNRGVCALVQGKQVALFRTSVGLLGVSNRDPFSGANVISRGSAGGRVTVTSPMYKQRFDLQTGECLDDPGYALEVIAVREVDGFIWVCLE